MKVLRRYLKSVDLVLEVLDARCPLSSRSAFIKKLAPAKFRIIILNKCDLADRSATEKWLQFWQGSGEKAVALNSREGTGMRKLLSLLDFFSREVNCQQQKRGRMPRELRAAVLGIPNVGKSTLINKLIGKRIALVGNRPGITKGPQWIRIGDVFLLDTAGMLQPNLKSEEDRCKLAAIGVLDVKAYDEEDTVYNLLKILENFYPSAVAKALGLPVNEEFVQSFAKQKGFLLPNNLVDAKRAATFFLNLFREGKIGKYTLDSVLLNEQ